MCLRGETCQQVHDVRKQNKLTNNPGAYSLEPSRDDAGQWPCDVVESLPRADAGPTYPRLEGRGRCIVSGS